MTFYYEPPVKVQLSAFMTQVRLSHSGAKLHFLLAAQAAHSPTCFGRAAAPGHAWLRMRSIRSGPEMPSGKPGKFSTSVVVISWPPLTPPACTEPSLKRSGHRLSPAPDAFCKAPQLFNTRSRHCNAQQLRTMTSVCSFMQIREQPPVYHSQVEAPRQRVANKVRSKCVLAPGSPRTQAAAGLRVRHR